MSESTETGINRASDLHRVMKANEEIKKVVRISSEVNLVALNAMLIAKRSGEKSHGFRVVSSELRVFSRKLNEVMSGLGALVFSLVNDVARIRKQNRTCRYLRAALNQGGSAGILMAPIVLRKEEEMRSTGRMVQKDWGKLLLQVNRALQLCEMGGALSRSAKIEAVYGGSMSITLKQVANQIELTVDDILSTLKSLRTQVAE